MPALPNSHEVLFRNRSRLLGRTAFIGLTHPGLLDQIDGGGLVMTENAGTYGLVQSRDAWTCAFGYGDPSLSHACADTVVVFVPKTRSELSLRLSLALWMVTGGGRVLLAGEKKEGVAGAVRQLREHFPQSEKVDSARHCQVWQADGVWPSDHFRLADWVQWHRIERHDLAIEVAGLPGIFSDGELDAGTALLLDTLARQPLLPGPTLDFACGAGVVGAWYQRFLSQRQDPVFPVDGADVQSQAVTCARLTYERAGAEGSITASDGLAAVAGRYQSVVTNPPFHTGIRTDTSVTEQFLQGAGRHLEKGGELRLVANRFLPYESLIKRHIGPTSVLAEDNRFVVWCAKKA